VAAQRADGGNIAGKKQNEEQPPLVAGMEVQDDRTAHSRRPPMLFE
jgi:hypothetical protein